MGNFSVDEIFSTCAVVWVTFCGEALTSLWVKLFLSLHGLQLLSSPSITQSSVQLPKCHNDTLIFFFLLLLFSLFYYFILTTRQCRYAWFNMMTLFLFFCVLLHMRNREPVNVPIKQKPGPPHLHPVWSDCNKSCICLPWACPLLHAHLLKSSPLPFTYGLNCWKP